jgi:type II secretory pathway pseudopilin PulG
MASGFNPCGISIVRRVRPAGPSMTRCARLLVSRNASRGFTYIGLMIFVALIGIGLAFAGQVWHAAMQREKEKELMFIGDQFRTAIAKYYEWSPGGGKKFPRSLEDLLEDRRYPTTKRHLRRIYDDPMTGRADWGLVAAPDGSIMGVYSQSEEEPRKISGFRTEYEKFAEAKKYSDWKFTFDAAIVADKTASPGQGGPQPGGGPPPGTPPPQPAPHPPVPTVPSKDDPNRKKICDNFLRIDRGTCTSVRQTSGDEAGARCDQSALLRNAACLDAERLPPLVTPAD